MREVRLNLYVKDGVLKVEVNGIDRENRLYESLNPDGTWRTASLYHLGPDRGFVVSQNQTQDIVGQLTP